MPLSKLAITFLLLTALPAVAQSRHVRGHHAVHAAPAPAREAFGPPPPPATPFDACDQAIAFAERGIPAKLLPAISRVESGRLDPATGRVRAWPWTINVEGVGHFFDSKEQVIAAVTALQAKGVRSIDVGCMQVNLMHHPKAFASLDQAFEPMVNAAYAARFLTALHGQLKDWNLATAAYHSMDPVRGEEYQRLVLGRVMTPMGASGTASGGTLAALRGLNNPYGAWVLPADNFQAFAPASLAFGAFGGAVLPSPGLINPLPKPVRRR